MKHNQNFKSVLCSPSTPRHLSKSRRPEDSSEEYDSDDMNANGALNNSRLYIVKPSQLTEPDGWYLGRDYYVVTRGSAVGIFHRLSVLIPLFPYLLLLLGSIGRRSIGLSHRSSHLNGKPARPGSRLSSTGNLPISTTPSFWSVRRFGIHLA